MMGSVWTTVRNDKWVFRCRGGAKSVIRAESPSKLFQLGFGHNVGFQKVNFIVETGSRQHFSRSTTVARSRGQKTSFFEFPWKRVLFPRRPRQGALRQPRGCNAHILALALAPGVCCPPDRGLPPPRLRCSHMKAQKGYYEPTPPRAGGRRPPAHPPVC